MTLLQIRCKAASDALRAELTGTVLRSGSGIALSTDHRAILRALIALMPTASHGAIARRFTTATGHPLSKFSVRLHRSSPSQAGMTAPPLLPEQAAFLGRLIDSHGGRNYPAIAAAFAQAVGRTVSTSTVCNHVKQQRVGV